MSNTFKGKVNYDLDMCNEEIFLISYEKFREIMPSRNIETNNSKLHNRITTICNPNREHWLKKFMNLYLQDDEQSE